MTAEIDCPECSGELQHQNEVAIQCLQEREHSFGHFVNPDGTDVLIDSEGKVVYRD